MARAAIATPVGEMIALATDTALCALEFDAPRRTSSLIARLDRWFSPYELVEASSALIERARAWLGAYFAGPPAEIPALSLDTRGTPFERQVWAALRRIPPGDTTTYGRIARQIGSDGASRAVGLANGANPIAIIVPCHRVIGSDGTLTGYGGGLERKAWLLNHERRWRGNGGADGRLPLDG